MVARVGEAVGCLVVGLCEKGRGDLVGVVVEEGSDGLPFRLLPYPPHRQGAAAVVGNRSSPPSLRLGVSVIVLFCVLWLNTISSSISRCEQTDGY